MCNFSAWLYILTSKPASEHPSWDSGYQGISWILIKSTGDIWVIGDIANNARDDGIRNILGIPGILGLGIIQDMRAMLNIRDIGVLEY